MTKTIIASLAIVAAPAFAGTAMVQSTGGAPAPVTSSSSSSANCPATLSYNHVTAVWDGALPKNADDAFGATLKLELSFVDMHFLNFEAGFLSSDDNDSGGFLAGMGIFVPMADNIHFVAEAGGVIEDGEGGFYVRPAIRSLCGCLENHSGLKYVNTDEEERWEIWTNFYYHLNQNIALTVGAALLFDDDFDFNENWGLNAGVRYGW